MSEEQNENQISPEQEKQIALALQISKKAIEDFNLPKMISGDREQFTEKRYEVFYQEKENEFLLSIEFNSVFTKAMLHISLTDFVWNTLNEVESLLSSPNSMVLLVVEDCEREQTIYDKTLALTKDFIIHLPSVVFHSFHQAAKETIINHIKKNVEYDLRKDWEEMGLPKDYTIIPNNSLRDIIKIFPDTQLGFCGYLETVDEEYTAYRKGAYRNRQIWLKHPQVSANLPNDYEQLKLQYKQAKKEYKLEHEAFNRVKRGATGDEWKKYWEEIYDEKFPNIFLSEEIPFYSASELAYKQLATVFGFSPEYMEKLVGNAKAQAKSQAKRDAQKTDNRE